MKEALKRQFENVKPGDVGIVGRPVQHSLSPAMHNAAFQTWDGVFRDKHGATPRYHLFDVNRDELNELLDGARTCAMRGLNITVPHKVAAASMVTRLDRFAARVGAINTIAATSDGWVGYNTDGTGFENAIAHKLEFDPREKKAVVLGAGGTGRLIVTKLLEMGAESVFWWNRTSEKIREAIDSKPAEYSRITAVTDDQLKSAVAGADLIVNATSVGLSDTDEMPAPGIAFQARHKVFDVIYHRQTKFLQTARAAGAHAEDGLEMLLYQGAKAFEIWTATPAPIEVMREALVKSLKKV